MSKILLLEIDGNMVEKKLSVEKILNIDELNLKDFVENTGSGEIEKILKCNYQNDCIIFYGWKNGDSKYINKSKLSIPNKNSVFYGDLICLITDHENNILEINKNIYNDSIYKFFNNIIGENINLQSGSDTDDNIEIESNKIFCFSNHIRDNFF